MALVEATHQDSIYVYMLWFNLSISIVVCKATFGNQLLHDWIGAIEILNLYLYLGKWQKLKTVGLCNFYMWACGWNWKVLSAQLGVGGLHIRVQERGVPDGIRSCYYVNKIVCWVISDIWWWVPSCDSAPHSWQRNNSASQADQVSHKVTQSWAYRSNTERQAR